MGLDVNVAEGRFVLGDVLLENVEEGLGLLRAKVDALEVVDVDKVRRVLGDETEHEEKVPEIGANLDGVGIAFAVVGAVDQVNFGSGIGVHNEKGALVRS